MTEFMKSFFNNISKVFSNISNEMVDIPFKVRQFKRIKKNIIRLLLT